jgi:predicted nucleic acid-binding protein
LIYASDTNAFIYALEGVRDPRLTLLRNALRSRELLLPPIVVTELASAKRVEYEPRRFVTTIPLLDIHEGYWERAGMLRADVKARNLRAKLADCLVAQSCIDNDVPLITYDRDFRHFMAAGLKLA